MPQQQFQQREFARRQWQHAAIHGRPVRLRIEPHAGVLQHVRLRFGGPSRQRMQPCQQFLERERLDQVIVGAGIQRLDAVADPVARGQHQHPRTRAARRQRAQHAEAVQPRQAEIEHHEIVAVPGQEPVGLHPVAGDVHREAGRAQAARERAAQAFRILDQEQLHVQRPSCNTGKLTPRAQCHH